MWDSLFHTGLGMQFDTPEQRTDYFAKADQDPRNVPIGAAMSHAASTNLGIWGSEDALQRDCASIMAYEVAHLALQKGVELSQAIHPNTILESSAFQEAFGASRSGPDSTLQSVIDEIGIRRHLGRHENADPTNEQNLIENTTNLVFDELARRRALVI